MDITNFIHQLESVVETAKPLISHYSSLVTEYIPRLEVQSFAARVADLEDLISKWNEKLASGNGIDEDAAREELTIAFFEMTAQEFDSRPVGCRAPEWGFNN